MATRTRREIIEAGAKAAGKQTVEVIGDHVTECLGQNADQGLRKKAKDAGTRSFAIVGDDLAAGLGDAPKEADKPAAAPKEADRPAKK